MTHTALFGLHNPAIEYLARRYFTRAGYQIDTATSVEELIAKARSTPCAFYLLDANFGKSRSQDITPALKIYEIVRERVEKGDAQFLAISGSLDTITRAQENGIPAQLSVEVRFSELFR